MEKEVSFVIPCYQSEHMIQGVVKRLQDVAETRMHENEYEIILVDDCSPDATLTVIAKIAKKFSNVKVLSFSRNFGQQAALMAGFSVVTGKIIVCLDDDGQTPPEEVFKLIDKLNEGYDLVYANYVSKKHSLFRVLGSRLNEKMAESLIGKPKDITLSSFYAAKRFLILEALRYTNPFAYIAGQLLCATRNIANVQIEHHKRLEGKSGYSLKKLAALWLNGFTAFSVKPLRVASVLGFALAAGGLLIALIVAIRRLLDTSIEVGWTSTIVLQLIIGGLILFVLGMIGEYIGRLYISSNNTPQYVIKESFNCDTGKHND